ncbi:hypothetical protein ASG43_17185 [Aureimonas sp. Leaf454]|uniref:hypothetical protein n=1 Tax=Aureimonas sp. Leaf454 TaxID=1736381 RepID=UPI0006F44DF2|nr:hypothetical protein [Aureimonas sp. Leaf454]KQT42014.1 hypothetical protein ASG43_17185 [Aureimonas sp. Leaf454]
MTQSRDMGGTGGPSSDGPRTDPWPADDIVDVGTGGINPELNRSFTPTADAPSLPRDRDESEDVPLDVQITDALSMLADGGHDYGSRPVVPEDETEGFDTDAEVDADDFAIIDESSKDA